VDCLKGLKNMTLLGIIGVSSTIGAGIIAQVPVPDGSFEAIGKWPVTIALIALAALSVFLAFRMADKARQSQDKASDALLKIAEQLAQRPCIRDKEND